MVEYAHGTPSSTLDSAPSGYRGRTAKLALAVADANWFTTENLFREVSHERASTLLLKCMDYRNAWQRGQRPWSWGRPLQDTGPGHWQTELVLPTGWMKQYPRLGMRPIGRAIRRWRARHAAEGPFALVMTYPHYRYLRDLVRPDLSVYLNLDDYALYWPRQAERLRALEQALVREADLTVCVSRLRTEQLREAVSTAAGRIRHLPHGTPSPTLGDRPWDTPAPVPDDIAHLPRPILGYIGSLEDRVDWRLMDRLSAAFPAASIVVVGRPVSRPPDGGQDWFAECERFLSRPNVHAIGWRPQEAIALYNRSFDVCLIPYKVDHPFNRACCPTKIMDCMGTGRPIVATATPECELYEELFRVADSDEAFLRAVGTILAAGSEDGRAARRFEWARANTCARVADRLLDWLPR